jgi:CO dehydrogenase maturation factor
MSFRMAIAGKGGTGKSTLAALAARALVDSGRGPVLAVDADPNATLAPLLGLEPDTTLADVREEGNELGRNETSGISKHAAVQLALQTAVCEGKNLDMVTMGRPEGPGCYCYVNNLLRGFLDELGDSYPWVVMDNEAGMEHLSRRTTNNVHLLVIIYEPTAIGVTTAGRLNEMSLKLPVTIGKRVFVANRVPPEGCPPELAERIAALGLTPEVEVPVDDTVYQYSVVGRSVFDLPENTPALAAMRAAVERWDDSLRTAGTPTGQARG